MTNFNAQVNYFLDSVDGQGSVSSPWQTDTPKTPFPLPSMAWLSVHRRARAL